MSHTIVLIHGYGFDQREWLPVEIAFEGFQTIYFSLPGFASEIPREPYTIATLAKRYWDSIDAVAHPTVHLAGHSMGGYVCIEMAAQQPSRVASLALIHSHVFEDSAEKKSQRTVTMGNIKSNGRSALVNKMIPSLFADAHAFSPLVETLVLRGMSYDDLAWYYGAQAMRDRADHGQTLSNLNVPVLMIAGNKDGAVPPEVIYQQSHLPAQNTLHVYDETGHMGMYENTAQMICDLISFYKS
jgi:pimeloyl-ACP methyl ester carboxylesterase